MPAGEVERLDFAGVNLHDADSRAKPVPPPSWRDHLVDRTDALSHPYEPPVLVLAPILAVGKLVVVAAPGGTGKTALTHEAARAVATGTTLAGMTGPEDGGGVLLVDGELGRYATTQRLKRDGWPEGIEVLDANGWDLAARDGHAAAMLHDAIAELRPALVVIDSLKALTPSARENDSDDMAPVMRRLANLAHDVKLGSPAILLVHHEGWSDKRTRGSSAIQQQADAVFAMHTNQGGSIEVTSSTAGLKPPNWGPAPPSLWVKVDDRGRIVAASHETAAERYRREILAALPAKSKAAIAKQCTTDNGKPATASNPAFTAAFELLEQEQAIHELDGQWRRNGAVMVEPAI